MKKRKPLGKNVAKGVQEEEFVRSRKRGRRTKKEGRRVVWERL